MSKSRLVVTDHALLRYIERAMKVDIQSIRAHLSKQVKPIHDCGASGAWVDGVWVVLEGNRLITVLPNKPSVLSRSMDRSLPR